MDSELVRMLNHRIQWEKFISRDGAGKASYGTPIELPCFLDGGVRIIKNKMGYDAVSELLIVLDGTSEATQITLDDRIRLPSGKTPPILLVQQIYDEYGTLDHVEVYV